MKTLVLSAILTLVGAWAASAGVIVQSVGVFGSNTTGDFIFEFAPGIRNIPGAIAVDFSMMGEASFDSAEVVNSTNDLYVFHQALEASVIVAGIEISCFDFAYSIPIPAGESIQVVGPSCRSFHPYGDGVPHRFVPEDPKFALLNAGFSKLSQFSSFSRILLSW